MSVLQIGKIMLKNQKSRVFQNEPWSRVFQYSEFQSEQDPSVSVFPDPKKTEDFSDVLHRTLLRALVPWKVVSNVFCLIFRHDFNSTE